MKRISRRIAGSLLIIFPTIIYGGVNLLNLLMDDASGYAENELRQDLWRAGHAHAGVVLILALVCLKYVDDAQLSELLKNIVRNVVPISALLLPIGFFLSVLSPDATEPNGFIYFAYVGAAVLAIALVILGVGLLRKKD